MSAMPTQTKMTVPLLDLKAQYADLRTEIDEAVRGVMESARFIGGPEVSGLEDAAQAIGSEWEGKRAGSVGDTGCFSFFPSKNLGGAGDGGMVVTQSAERADRLKLLREHGARPKYHHGLVGTNSRLDALQAAILRVKLKHLDRWSEQRARNAELYDHLFDGSRVGRPWRDPRGRHIYNQYVIRG